MNWFFNCFYSNFRIIMSEGYGGSWRWWEVGSSTQYIQLAQLCATWHRIYPWAAAHSLCFINAPQQISRLCTSLHMFHRARNQPLIKVYLSIHYCFVCVKRKWTSIAVISSNYVLGFIFCVSTPDFLVWPGLQKLIM